MREGHLRQGKLGVRSLIHSVGESICSSYYEYDVFTRVGDLVLDDLSQLYRCVLLSFLIQQYHIVGRTYVLEYQFALLALYPIFA